MHQWGEAVFLLKVWAAWPPTVSAWIRCKRQEQKKTVVFTRTAVTEESIPQWILTLPVVPRDRWFICWVIGPIMLAGCMDIVWSMAGVITAPWWRRWRRRHEWRNWGTTCVRILPSDSCKLVKRAWFQCVNRGWSVSEGGWKVGGGGMESKNKSIRKQREGSGPGKRRGSVVKLLKTQGPYQNQYPFSFFSLPPPLPPSLPSRNSARHVFGRCDNARRFFFTVQWNMRESDDNHCCSFIPCHDNSISSALKPREGRVQNRALVLCSSLFSLCVCCLCVFVSLQHTV